MAHAISEMKQSGIELGTAKKRNRAGHGENRRNAKKHAAHAISEMKQSGIELGMA